MEEQVKQVSDHKWVKAFESMIINYAGEHGLPDEFMELLGLPSMRDLSVEMRNVVWSSFDDALIRVFKW